MKILLLSNASPNQRALAHKVHASFPIAAQVLVRPVAGRQKGMARWRSWVQRAASALAGRPLAQAWQSLQDTYARQYPLPIDVESLQTGDINADIVLELVDRIAPDLTIVSGTNLLRQPIIDRLGSHGCVMNLHTGISPYIKGGPNCTNWCLAIDRPDLIGNTIMWIDAGIDSGRLIATEATPLTGTRTLIELHLRVMEHAHNLYLRAIGHAMAGSTLPAIDQATLPDHHLFYTRDWTFKSMLAARRHFIRHAAISFTDVKPIDVSGLVQLPPLVAGDL